MDRLITALNTTGYLFAHHAWDEAPKGDYGIYAEDEGDDLIADNKHIERGTRGYIDFFTRDDTSVPRDTIESALNGVCSFSLESIQFEEDTGYIHYAWRWYLYG